MIRQASPILDSFGRRFERSTNGHNRLGLADLLARDIGQQKPAAATNGKPKDIQATYDAARQGSWLSNYWAQADHLDADSANSISVRQYLVTRSRYEEANNGYYKGAIATYATDLIGTGPLLRMQTASTPFNQMVEREFWAWAQAIGLRRKLATMARAKTRDGEAIGIVRRNPNVRHAVKLDVVLYETEQCQTPYLPWDDPTYIDGIKFDEFGDPIWYDILRQHPGSGHWGAWVGEPERVPAEFVLHWFRCERPGQHRGVPPCASTLNIGAALRQMRISTVQAADTAARLGAALLKTPLPANDLEAVPDETAAFSTLEIPAGSITALPFGTDALQLKPEHPATTYSDFMADGIREQFRPLSMPKNKSLCDSSNYNYASGRLDHQTYYAEQDVDREDCGEQVLNKLFGLWLREAIAAFGWFGGDPDAIGPAALVHAWDWPKHRVVDIEAEANAHDKNLRNGQLTIDKLYTANGEDYEDCVQLAAQAHGISVDDMRLIHLHAIFPEAAAVVLGRQAQAVGMPGQPNADNADEETE